MTQAERIAALEARIAQLEARLAMAEFRPFGGALRNPCALTMFQAPGATGSRRIASLATVGSKVDWKQRFSDICSDCRRWLRQAFSEWGEAIKDDPIQHGLSFVAGGVLVAGVIAAL